jgi:hypothetical protein
MVTSSTAYTPSPTAFSVTSTEAESKEKAAVLPKLDQFYVNSRSNSVFWSSEITDQIRENLSYGIIRHLSLTECKVFLGNEFKGNLRTIHCIYEESILKLHQFLLQMFLASNNEKLKGFNKSKFLQGLGESSLVYAKSDVNEIIEMFKLDHNFDRLRSGNCFVHFEDETLVVTMLYIYEENNYKQWRLEVTDTGLLHEGVKYFDLDNFNYAVIRSFIFNAKQMYVKSEFIKNVVESN